MTSIFVAGKEDLEEPAVLRGGQRHPCPRRQQVKQSRMRRPLLDGVVVLQKDIKVSLNYTDDFDK